MLILIIQYYNYMIIIIEVLIYKFFVDLVKRGVLPLSVRFGEIKITAIIILFYFLIIIIIIGLELVHSHAMYHGVSDSMQ